MNTKKWFLFKRKKPKLKKHELNNSSEELNFNQMIYISSSIIGKKAQEKFDFFVKTENRKKESLLINPKSLQTELLITEEDQAWNEWVISFESWSNELKAKERREKVANALGFEKDKSKINNESSTSKSQSSSSKSQKM